MMGRLNKSWRLIPFLAAVMLFLSGCQGALDPQGPAARDQFFLIMLSVGIMSIVLVVVFALWFYVLIRFRKRKGQTGYPKQIEGNRTLEMIWTTIPFVLVLILAVPTVYFTFKEYKDYRDDEDTLHIKVMAHQFWWEFEYPDDGIITANDMVIPAGKNVAVTLQASDVAHSFWIPDVIGKKDAFPGTGNINYASFSVDNEGVYKGKCAEFCGASHALMDFKLVVVSPTEYDQWVAHMTTPQTAAGDLSEGEVLFRAQCITCHAVEGDLRSSGPNLKNFANRETLANFRPNDAEWMAKWLADPQKVKPGSLMPNLGLDDHEIASLTQYLQSLN